MTDADRQLFSGDDGPSETAHFPGPDAPTQGTVDPEPRDSLRDLAGGLVGTREKKALAFGSLPALAGIALLPFAPLLGVITLTVAATLAALGVARLRRAGGRDRPASFYLGGVLGGVLAGLLSLGLQSALTSIVEVAA